jgi:[acyl-carrier-protein] S-malonyltransferase
MNRAVFLFPGQGSQEPGMGKLIQEAFPDAAAVFERAGTVLGKSFLDTLFHAGADELRDTRIAQPAVFVVNIATAQALRSLGVTPCGVAGHSLGEYCALVEAGALGFEEGLKLVQDRARFMSECAARSKGAMVTVLGMTRAEVEKIVAERAHDCPVEVANVNCPGQIVVSGREECVEQFAAVALANGARKTVKLQVSGAFHSELMSPASQTLSEVVHGYRFGKPRVPFVSNVTANFVSEPEQIRSLLVEQVRRPVLWEESVLRFIGSGYRLFVEAGPGRVLQGLMKRINPEIIRQTAIKLRELSCQNAGASSQQGR